MRNFIVVCLTSIVMVSCHEVCVEPMDCTTPATVRDLAGLDGCGWVFELSDGSVIEPQRLMFCGTPPLPKEVTEDPLYNFEWADGKTVYISYEATEGASICMVGTLAKITCVSERVVDTNE
jgi:hypothetical protein